MTAPPSTGASTRVVLTYRVLQHWRTPVFRRLASWPGFRFMALHGGDFPGTKAVNGKQLSGFEHRELATLRFDLARDDNAIPMPLCPTLPWHLWRERPDVILTEGGSNLFNNFLTYAYAALTRTPIVWWTLGELRGEQALSRTQRLFRWLVRQMELRATALLGYSSVAIEYFDRQGYPKERQFRAVNCVDTDKVMEETRKALPRVDALRKQYDLEGKRVLLFVGALIPPKRLEDLIHAHARLVKRHPDLRLLIVGGGSHREALEREVEAIGAEGVIFTGQVIDDVHAYFELGDVFVLPGLGGLAISEAMAHGLPVLATEADGCEVDLVEEGMNGYLLPVGDRDVLEARLEEILDDPERLERMSAHSRWVIDNRYNIHTYMENVAAAVRYAHTGQRDVPPPQVGD
jgi:glycosyltransferase involved in cell wall biosynthesis